MKAPLEEIIKLLPTQIVTVTICTEHTRSRNMEATFRRKFDSVPTIVWLNMCSLDPHKFNRVEYGLCTSFSGNIFSFKGGAFSNCSLFEGHQFSNDFFFLQICSCVLQEYF